MDSPHEPANGYASANSAGAPGAIRRGAFRPHHHVQQHPRPPYPPNRGGFQPRPGPGFQRGSFRPAFIPRGRGRGGSFGPGGPGGAPNGPRPPVNLPPGSQPLALPQVERRELKNVVPNEETIKNDYASWFALSGTWSAGWVKRVDPEEDCKEYPKLRHLIDMKQSQVDQLSHPPFHLTITPSPTNGLTFSSPGSLLSVLPTNTFSSILITPPPLIFAPNNATTSPVHPADASGFTYTDLLNLPVRTMSSDPSFVFLWVGEASGLGLERGREALLKWGYRRCEEVLWVKQNTKGTEGNVGAAKGKDRGDAEKPRNLLVNMKEHCLMGIRGTVRRKTDGWFVHCNVDTDVMVYEQDPDDPDPPPYPPKLMSVVENFCLGTRRLHLFAPKSSARRGWVTVGQDDTLTMSRDAVATKVESLEESADNKAELGNVDGALPDASSRPDVLDWDLDAYNDHVRPNEFGQYVLPEVQEIENLRPKSPVRGDRGGRSDPANSGVAGGGRGPAMGYGTDMGPGGARLARGGGPRMGTAPRMGATASGLGGGQNGYFDRQGGGGGGGGGMGDQGPRGTATLAGASPSHHAGGSRHSNNGLNGVHNPSFNPAIGPFNGAMPGGANANPPAGGQGGSAFGLPGSGQGMPNEMLMAMAMQQLQMQMQLQQQQFALRQQEMYRTMMAQQQQQGGGAEPAQGFAGTIGEDEYDGQNAWRPEGQ